MMIAILKGTEIVISKEVLLAESIGERIRGLMLKKSIDDSESLLIMPCNSIHTCFMRFSIDALFLSNDDTIVHIIRNMKPWRFSSIHIGSKKVLELNAGRIGNKLKAGDQLEFRNV